MLILLIYIYKTSFCQDLIQIKTKFRFTVPNPIKRMRPSTFFREWRKMEFIWYAVTNRLFINVIQVCDLLRMLVWYNVHSSD